MNKQFYLFVLFFSLLFNYSSAQITISGKVVRHNGMPVSGVTVSCTGVASTVTTDTDGVFSFSELPEGQTYTIRGTLETDYFDEMTILDVVYLRDFILGIIPFSSDFQSIAADMNGPGGGISAFDLVKIMLAATRLETDIPDNYWKFFDGTAGASLNEEEIRLINVMEDVSELELVAVKLGDVAIDEDHIPPFSDVPQPAYYFEDRSLVEEEIVDLPVRIRDIKKVIGIQQTLSWNTSALEFISFESLSGFVFQNNETLVGSGDLIIFGTGSNGIPPQPDMEDGETLYTLQFRALQSFDSLEGLIDFTENIIPQQSVYKAEDGMLYITENADDGLPTSIRSIENLESFTIAPNPTQDDLAIQIDFAKTEKADLSLFDLSGRLIRSWDIDGKYFTKTISLQGLAKGTYMLSLRTDTGVETKRLVKY